MTVTREKTDLTAKLEEIDEDMNDVMKKYKAAVQQVSTQYRCTKHSRSVHNSDVQGTAHQYIIQMYKVQQVST